MFTSIGFMLLIANLHILKNRNSCNNRFLTSRGQINFKASLLNKAVVWLAMATNDSTMATTDATQRITLLELILIPNLKEMLEIVHVCNTSGATVPNRASSFSF